MTWVKICGITNLEDAQVAVDAGADAVGFVFYEKSPRCVTVETAREIVEKLPENVEKIGVFVSEHENPIEALLRARLTGTQLYVTAEGVAGSKASPKAIGASLLPLQWRYMIAMPMRLIDAKAIRQLGRGYVEVGNAVTGELQQIPLPPEFPVPTIVLDSGSVRLPGGTGETFDWDQAAPLSSEMRQNGVRMVVAGGLTPENVGEAIEILHPWGVDVASGVEAQPGKKDPEKVRAFVRAVREHDRKGQARS
jgi:phosphoribosylanthranilate isomerase